MKQSIWEGKFNWSLCVHMCVFIFAYEYMCVWYTYACLYVCVDIFVCTLMCSVYVMLVCVLVFIFIYVHMHACVCVIVCACVCSYLCIYMCVHACVCVYICKCICVWCLNSWKSQWRRRAMWRSGWWLSWCNPRSHFILSSEQLPWQFKIPASSCLSF